MKKLQSFMSIILFILLFIPCSIKASNETNPIALASPEKSVSADAEIQLSRLEEIKSMDLYKLSQSEKKEFREEVLAIQNSQYERGRHGGYHDRGNYGHRSGGRHHGFLPGLLIILLLIALLK
jgi:hypothetical protein